MEWLDALRFRYQERMLLFCLFTSNNTDEDTPQDFSFEGRPSTLLRFQPTVSRQVDEKEEIILARVRRGKRSDSVALKKQTLGIHTNSSLNLPQPLTSKSNQHCPSRHH
eukprot:228081-Amorphochlora_amoeboformis.AAC.2